MDMCKNSASLRLAFILASVLLAWSHAEAATSSVYKVAVRDRLEPLPSGAVTLGGHLGHKLNQCITNRVLSQDVDKLVKPFRERTESTLKEWRGEYWGKWLTSAVLGYKYRTMAEQKTQIDEAVR